MQQELNLNTTNTSITTKSYATKYYHEGCWWGLTIDAADYSDAETRCKKLGLQLLGELVATYQVPTTPPGLIMILVYLLNYLQRLFGFNKFA